MLLQVCEDGVVSFNDIFCNLTYLENSKIPRIIGVWEDFFITKTTSIYFTQRDLITVTLATCLVCQCVCVSACVCQFYNFISHTTNKTKYSVLHVDKNRRKFYENALFGKYGET